MPSSCDTLSVSAEATCDCLRSHWLSQRSLPLPCCCSCPPAALPAARAWYFARLAGS